MSGKSRIAEAITLRAARLITLVVLIGSCFQSSCSDERKIIGKWKWQSSNCVRAIVAYPEKLEFFDNGSYVGEFSFLNGGNYSIVDRHRIKLDTVVGPRVYEFDVSEDVLTLRSDSDCS